jgi:signal transduction histidine kinase/CheY-like chemotaxis protein
VVTLIDGRSQYVLCEATKSLSLMDDAVHRPGDELWLGNALLPRGQGMSEFALRPTEYTARDPDGTTFKAPAMVVPDTTMNEQFKGRAFAGSGVTFYSGVPLTTKLGHPIGVYSVTDDRSRSGLTAQELRFMVDMATIVVQHLEVIKNDRARARGERLVQGIGAFIEGHSPDSGVSSARRASSSKSADTTPAKEGAKEKLARPSLARNKNSSSRFKGMTISDANIVGRRKYPSHDQEEEPNTFSTEDYTHLHRVGDDGKPIQQATQKTLQFGEGDLVTTDADGVPLPSQRAKSQQEQIFDRASKILRRSLGADGVVFIDASSANLSQSACKREKRPPPNEAAKLSRSDTRERHDLFSAVGVQPSMGDRNYDDSISSDTQESADRAGRSHKADQPCEIIAESLHGKHLLPSLRLSQRSLWKLLRRYPNGKCYTFDESGRLASSDVSSESSIPTEGTADLDEAVQEPLKPMARRHPLLSLLPGARIVVFLPLWDYTKNRWNSAAVIWSSNPAKLFNIQDDLAYLTAFGNSVMNELARLNLLVSDNAKATFLANISHELRSPLHGILGSIEFLHESPLDDFQSNMVISVETCGKTLLDTCNNLLDFAKLNNLSRTGQRGIIQATTSDSSLTSVFDLAMIVEEAVEAVYAGQVFRVANADALEGKGPPLSSYNRAMQKRQDTKAKIALGQAVLSSDVKLTLNIDEKADWHVSSQPGAIRRIVMNLLGNSLKYTESGSIDVSLEIDDSRLETDNSHTHACIIVNDTGRGMSEDFVKNYAFTAFSQENSLTSGVGLGLSIIRQIVDSLGGKIDLRSQKDVGTEVKIWLSLQTAEAPPGKSILRQMQERTGGMTMCLLNPRGDLASPTVESPAERLGKKMTIDESLKNLTLQWFSMRVFSAPSMDDQLADYFVYAEPPPIEYLLQQHGENPRGSETPVLVLTQNAFQANSLRANGIHHLTEIGRIIEVVAQPIGPQKLSKVLQRCMQRKTKHDKSSDESSRPVTLFLNRDDEINDSSNQAEKHSRNSDVTRTGERHQSASGPSVSRPKLDHRATAPSPTHRKETSHMPPPSSSPSSPTTKKSPADPSAPRILVVDDNDINLQLLVAFVRRAKLSFEQASDGSQALEAYKRCALSEDTRFRYVVMDISMPVMDGVTATREIRKFEKQHGIQPPADIIALTGMGEESDIKEEAQEAGCTSFLTKPVKFQVLRELLR